MKSLTELLVFFFSSRRRHTRWPRDWSSDVCSSDLDLVAIVRVATAKEPAHRYASVRALVDELERHCSHRPVSARQRSEERRVGKECKSLGGEAQYKKMSSTQQQQ